MALTPQQHDLLTAGYDYRTANLSLAPIDQHTKQPLFRVLPQVCTWPREIDAKGQPSTRSKGTWDGSNYRLPEYEEITEWVTEGAQLALVGGLISGGLLILDFDVARFYDAWRAAVGTLVVGLPIQRTGGGGYQVLVRCTDAIFWCDTDGRIRGNEKLAWVPDESKRDGRSIAIETRASRGYAVIAPSIHPSGTQYAMLEGDPTTIPVVSRAHIQSLLDAAVLLDEAPLTRDQMEKAAKAPVRSESYRSSSNGDGRASVIDAFNEAVKLDDQLKQAGYIWQGSRLYLPGNGDRLRPGVVLLDEGTRSFHHDSEDPLSDGYRHTAFDVFCHFDHGGDCKAAVKAAAADLGIAHEYETREPTRDIEGYACCPDCGKRLRKAKNGNGWRCIHDGGELGFWWQGGGYVEPHKTISGQSASVPPSVRLGADEMASGDVVRRSWLNADEIDQITDPTFLINDFLVIGQVTVIAGAGDSGKTFIVLDASLRTAEHYNVMYVAGEDAPGIKLRRNAWWQFWRRPRPERFLMWAEDFSLFDESSVRDFMQQIATLDLKLIVLDTLSQCSIGADENGTRDMSIVMGNAQRIAKTTGAAVLIIHHSTKDGNGYRGSSTIKFNTYGFYEVAKNDDIVELKPIRVKNAPSIKPRYFRFISVPVGEKESAVVAPAARVLSTVNLTDNQAKILTLLSLMTDSVGGARTTDLEKATGLNGGSFYKPLKVLREKMYLEDQGSKLVITPNGRKALQAHVSDPSLGTTPETDVPDVLFTVNTEFTTLTTPSLPVTTSSDKPLTTLTTPSPFRGGGGSKGSSEVAEEGKEPELPNLPESGKPQMYGYHVFDIPTSQPEPNGELFPEPANATPQFTENELRNAGYRWVKMGEEWHLYAADKQELGIFFDRTDAVDAARDYAQQEQPQ